jgi:hypothetical protein
MLVVGAMSAVHEEKGGGAPLLIVIEMVFPGPATRRIGNLGHPELPQDTTAIRSWVARTAVSRSASGPPPTGEAPCASPS